MELRVNNKLWIISDTHFGHKGILRFGARPENHETLILAEWTKAVRPTDQILHLGDVFFRNRSVWKVLINNLPGEKFLILGNHDKESNAYYEDCGFNIIEPFVVNGHAFTHRPVSDEYPAPEEWHTNIHGHTHNNEYNPDHDGTIDLTKKYINLCVEMTDYKPVQLGAIW